MCASNTSSTGRQSILVDGQLYERKSVEKNRKSLRVRFSERHNDQPRVEIFSYDAVPKELFAQLYYSPSEEECMFFEQRELAKKYLQHHPELVHSIYFLHGYDIDRRTKVSPENDPAVFRRTEDAKRILAVSDSRGLEPFLTRLILEHRHNVVDKVLSIQDQFKQGQQHPSEQLETILSIWSLRVSAGTINYARHLAQGDERMAAAIHQHPAYNKPAQPCQLGRRASCAGRRASLTRGNACDAKGIAIAA